MQYPGANWTSHAVDAAMNPMQVTGSNSPHVQWKDREFGESPLFKSPRGIALILDKMIAPGFGHLPAGLTVSAISAGPRKGLVFPSDFTGVPVKAAAGAGATKVLISTEDARFFVVGDKITLGDPSGTKETVTLKAMTAAANGVNLEFDPALANALTTSHFVHFDIFKGPIIGILEQAVFSDNGNGAYGTVVYSNAVLYKHKLLNDPNATALKAAISTVVVDGQYVILK